MLTLKPLCLPLRRAAFSSKMAKLHRLLVSPPLMNSSCAWASEEKQLRELYECKYTGAVTTRTATLNGFTEDFAVHTVRRPYGPAFLRFLTPCF